VTVPAWLANDPAARAAFARIRSRLVARGEWHPEFAIGLVAVALACSRYLRFARAIRALRDVDPENLKELEKHSEDYRRLAREILADFWMIPAERAHISAVDAEGLDAEIAALCAPVDA
jgi:hypothetical protein